MNSWRHHYIPQFYIKGFTNESNTLWVYDKLKDVIHSRPIPPKSIFFEKDLNTIQHGAESTDILEQYFSHIESELSREFVKVAQGDVENVSERELLESIAHIYMLSTLIFWRRPQDTYQMDALVKKYRDENPTWELYNDERAWAHLGGKQKMQILRAYTPAFIFSNPSKVDVDTSLFQINDSRLSFLISDNPILYNKTPVSESDFLHPILVPLSKNRYFYSSEKKIELEAAQIFLANLAIIDQAARYVGSHDRLFLGQQLTAYREVKSIVPNFLAQCRKEIFR